MKKITWIVLLCAVAQADWREAQSLLSTQSTLSFGSSVAVSANFALVGAPQEGSDGRVYIFKKDENGTWQQHQLISTMNVDDDLESGWYGVAGGVGTDVAVIERSGEAYAVISATHSRKYNDPQDRAMSAIGMFKYDGAQFVQHASFSAEGYDSLGVSLDIDYHHTAQPSVNGGIFIYPGDYVVVAGSPLEERMYLFVETGINTWSLRSTILTPYSSEVNNTAAGESVAIDCDGWTIIEQKEKAPCYVYVGAPDADVYEGHVDIGSICSYMYDNDTVTDGVCIASADESASTDNQHFGCAIDADSNRVIVGAKRTSAQDASGSVFIYNVTSTGSYYNQKHLFGSVVDENEDRFGHAVAIKGDRAAVGACGLGAPSGGGRAQYGGVFIYERNASDVWNETVSVRGKAATQSVDALSLIGSDLALDIDLLLSGAPSQDKAIFLKDLPPLTHPALLMYLLN